MDEFEEFTFFWDGPFSQWHPCYFVIDDDESENGRPYCWNVVFAGNMAKFGQNSYLLHELMKTDGTTIVEASPEDPIWGIGLGENDPGCHSRHTWQGLNWLGEVLTEVREHLKKHV